MKGGRAAKRRGDSGPLGTAAPTKFIVTRRRGGCPHPPVGLRTPRYPPSSAPCGGTFPLEGGRLYPFRCKRSKPFGVPLIRPSVPTGAPSPGGSLGTWGRNPSVTAAQPLAALLPYGCGVPLAGAALLGMTEKGLLTRLAARLGGLFFRTFHKNTEFLSNFPETLFK